jgi:hypothetical protein
MTIIFEKFHKPISCFIRKEGPQLIDTHQNDMLTLKLQLDPQCQMRAKFNVVSEMKLAERRRIETHDLAIT